MEEAVKEMDKIDQDEHERYLYLRRDMAYTDALSIKRTRERIAKEQEEKDIELANKQKYMQQQRNEINQMKSELEKMHKELQDKINKLS